MQTWRIVVVAQVVEHFTVLDQGLAEGVEAVVRQIVFNSRFANNFRKVAVVNMANVGEQVMFYLVVQTTYIPRKQARFWGEVGRVEQLAHRPISFDIAAFVGHWIIAGRYHVGWLKNHAQDQTCHHLHGQEAY